MDVRDATPEQLVAELKRRGLLPRCQCKRWQTYIGAYDQDGYYLSLSWLPENDLEVHLSMIPITYVVGDATDPQGPDPKIIAHVCNDVGGWGAGFVTALSRRWSQPEEQYRLWWRHRDGVPFELGQIQVVPIGPHYSSDIELWVANMIAQHAFSTHGEPAIRYDALESCLAKVAGVATGLQASVHMPRIGCGLAGGEWKKILPLINLTLCAADVPTYVYDLPTKDH